MSREVLVIACVKYMFFCRHCCQINWPCCMLETTEFMSFIFVREWNKKMVLRIENTKFELTTQSIAVAKPLLGAALIGFPLDFPLQIVRSIL